MAVRLEKASPGQVESRPDMEGGELTVFLYRASQVHDGPVRIGYGQACLPDEAVLAAQQDGWPASEHDRVMVLS